MLKTHIDTVESALLATSKIPANSGHALHKGTPREAFIRNFLTDHLSENVSIGTGEIIDAESLPNPPPNNQRNQHDIVIYKKEYPKISLGGGISAFLNEAVVATIEVKSVLRKTDLEQSISAAVKVKSLKRSVAQSFSTGYQPPGILSFVVSYAGPKRMKTVYNWIDPIHNKLGITLSALPPRLEDRKKVIAPTIDGIIVLGKGAVTYDTMPLSFLKDEMRAQHPDGKWQILEMNLGSLFLIFMILTTAFSGVSATWLDPNPYLKNFQVPFVTLGE